MDEESKVQWTVLENPVDVAVKACERIVAVSKQAILERGEFHIVLAGGSTPEKTYLLLAEKGCEWEHWHIWFGDERCLPVGHADRNSTMAEKSFYSQLSVPPKQIHVIPAELGSKLAAERYSSLLDGSRVFDLVLLGMGEDGHTASLFPGHEYPENKNVLAIHDAPKSPTERVSLSAEMLSSCRYMLFIIAGKRKFQALSRWRLGESLPVSNLNGIEITDGLVDKDAWAE